MLASFANTRPDIVHMLSKNTNITYLMGEFHIPCADSWQQIDCRMVLQIKESEQELDEELKETRFWSFLLPYLVWASRRNCEEATAHSLELKYIIYLLINLNPTFADSVSGRSTSLQGKIFQHKLKPKVVQGLKDLRNRLEEQERRKKWPLNVNRSTDHIELLKHRLAREE